MPEEPPKVAPSDAPKAEPPAAADGQQKSGSSSIGSLPPPPRVSSTPPPAPSAGGAASDEDPLLGSVLLDRVRIDRPIARGGMGKVYYGMQVSMKRPCAIKVLDPRLAGGGDVNEFTRRFLLEASTAAKLTHPNVVTIFDYGETSDGQCFIAMEYLEGRTLSEELKRNGKLSAERAVHVTRQVARALREAHALGVVHRDMKPGNVFLLKRDDDDDFAKVLDFGLVKETTPNEVQDQTQVGQIMGSPRYMAPEQVQGKAVDGRTDIYSVGVMFYAMLAGRPPFDKATDLATMMAQVSDAPPPIQSVAPDAMLPPGLEAIVMKCLAKNPDERFASMEELIAALKMRPGAGATTSDSGSHSAPRLLPPTISYGAPVAQRRSSVTAWVIAALAVGVAGTAAFLSRDRGDSQPTAAVSGVASAMTPPLSPPPVPPPPAPKPTATLHIETDPPGVKIKEEGETMCEATPCDIVYTGDQADPTYEHLLSFLKADYKLERKLVKVSASPLTVKMTRAR
jgi:serine/threonine protein kinase